MSGVQHATKKAKELWELDRLLLTLNGIKQVEKLTPAGIEWMDLAIKDVKRLIRRKKLEPDQGASK